MTMAKIMGYPLPEHGGDIYSNDADIDFSVSLNPAEMNAELKETVRAAMERGLSHAGYYPDILQRQVRKDIAKYEGVPETSVIAGSGASELIMVVCRMARPKKALLFEPSFSGYAHALSAVRDCTIKRVFLSEDSGFSLTADMAGEIDEDTDIVFVQDPWNPTGAAADDDAMHRIIERAGKCGAFAAVDESFFDLSEKSLCSAGAAQIIKAHENAVIIKSFTKSFAIPGIRIGYALSSPKNIAALSEQLPEWNLSSVASETAGACAGIAGGSDFLPSSVRQIRDERCYLTEELEKLGLKVFRSSTVFILFKLEGGCDLYGELLKRKIMIRDCRNIPGLGKGFYRIAVRGHEDNMKLVGTMRKVINGH